MAKRLAWYAAAVCLVFLAAIGFLFFRDRNTGGGSVQPPQPHFESDEKIKLSEIRLRIFYAVPQNQVRDIPKDWRSEIETAIQDLPDFHANQFHYASHIVPEIYSAPVVLERDNLYYDTADTNYGNPEGLKRIAPELERRFPDFIKTENGGYNVTAIVYEGVGAAGSPGAMILSRTFLSDPAYRNFRSSLFYHEFGHAIGLSDKYDPKTDQPSSNDIMGRGRLRPLPTNYIDPLTVKAMGVSVN